MKLTAKVQGAINRLRTASRRTETQQTRWQSLKTYWTEEWNHVSHTRLYIASAVSIGVLFATSYTALAHIQNTSDWQQVYTNGTYVGMVPNDPKVMDSMQRIALGYHVDVRFHDVHTYVPTGYNWEDVSGIPTQAVAITLNGQPVVYTKDADSAAQVLALVKQAFIPKGVKEPTNVQFQGDVGFNPVVVSASKVMSTQSAFRYILHPTSSTLVGRSGSLNAMVAFNDRTKTSSNQQPLLQVTVEQTVTKEVELPYSTHYVKDSHLGTGQIHVVKQGKPGKAREQLSVKYVNGHVVSQTVVHKDVVQQPVTEEAQQGTNSGVASGGWIWPSPDYDITSGFGWRRLGGGEYHPGVDIGCPIGTPIYATNNGVVEDAGWNSGGYGNWVKINNGNGIETVFGHMSRPVVHAGQTVSKGQIIGYSGATGNVTGPHLHYEVRMFGRAINPHPYM